MKRIARLFSVALLTLVVALTGTVLLCGALLPDPGREGERERLLRLGFRLTAIRFESPAFEEGALRFERVESYVRDAERHDLVSEVRIPATRGPKIDRSACAPFVRRILTHAELMQDRGALAISPYAPELALGSSGGILRRRSDGVWENACGGALPPALQRLNDANQGASPLQDRLAHPDPHVWLDAAVESILRHGVHARLFADGLGRGVDDDLLIRLLLDAGDPDEVARLAAEGTGLVSLRLLEELSRAEGKGGALVRVARRLRPGRGESVYVRDWIVGSLEDGSFEGLKASDRRVVYERMTRIADASFRDRLTDVLRHRDGASCVAAWLLLRRLEGETVDAAPDPALAPEAKRWDAERSRR